MINNSKSEQRITSNEKRFVSDAVCPTCFQPLPGPNVLGQGRDDAGREMRTYFGWCFTCIRGAAVVQFKREDRWIIHKYRLYDLSEKVQIIAGENIECCELEQDWVILNNLPEPAPVILGPGGDFKRPITPEISLFMEKLKPMRDALGKLVDTIDEWLTNDK